MKFGVTLVKSGVYTNKAVITGTTFLNVLNLGRHPVVQLLGCVRLFVTPRTTACQASLSFTISWSLLRFMSMESVILSNHLILCCPLLLLPSSFPASESFPMSQLFAWGGQSIRSFSFSISPSNEQPGLISFRMDWLDLLAVQGTLKSLLQHHNWKVSILRCSSFFIV